MDQATKLSQEGLARKAFSPPPVDWERTTCTVQPVSPANGRTIQQHLELCNLWPGPALHLSPPQPRILFSQVNQARLLSCSTPAVAGLCLTKIRNMNTDRTGLDWRIFKLLSVSSHFTANYYYYLPFNFFTPCLTD